MVVYGATASGAMASIAAAQHHMHVLLLEPGAHVGGMVTGGLSNSDVEGQEKLIGGLTRRFFTALGTHYNKPVAWAFEPHVAEQTMLDMLKSAGVELLFHARLIGVEKNGSSITRIRLERNRDFSAKAFIDSSYEGDLMKAAGVNYVVGRESIAKYNEPLAGRQDLLPGHHQFRFPVSADTASGLLPHVVPQQEVGVTGAADGRFQSYCFRLCLTENPADRLPVERPAAYDPKLYELARRYIESANGALAIGDFLGIVRIPNGKSDVNSTGPVSTDLNGASWAYPEANYQRPQQIWNEHLTWAQGLVYFLQNDPAVPTSIREQANRWGLPKDEFAGYRSLAQSTVRPRGSTHARRVRADST